MRILDYLIEKEIVKDLKEFQDLYAVRAFKVDGELLFDPNIEIENIHNIQVGCRVINVE